MWGDKLYILIICHTLSSKHLAQNEFLGFHETSGLEKVPVLDISDRKRSAGVDGGQGSVKCAQTREQGPLFGVSGNFQVILVQQC